MKKIRFDVTPGGLESPTIYFLRSSERLADILVDICAQHGLVDQSLLADFEAKADETLPIYGPTRRIFLVGLGTKPNLLASARLFFYRYAAKLGQEVGVEVDEEASIQELVAGIVAGQYAVGHHQEKSAPVGFFAADEPTVRLGKGSSHVIEQGVAWGETWMRVMHVVDAPPNFKTPVHLSDHIRISAAKYGYRAEVYDRDGCEKLGLEALLAVSRGSTLHPAHFVVLEYGQPGHGPTIGLVGKGVTFDTGGIGLKPGDNMHYMKSDMAGAAAVWGAVELITRWGLPVHVVAALPLTENGVDGEAMKPGDVIGSYAGKTIEVIHTDAEGRLILADGLAYLNRRYKPEYLVDVATLTGNCIQALGYHAAGLLSNNDTLADELLAAGQDTGERLWRLPLWAEYGDMMKSDIADIKNLSAAPLAGAITAAKFLEVFIEGHPQWAHLDIAGVAFGDTPYAKMKSATGWGMRLLVHWIQQVAQKA